ncbi:MAG: hypothetical protein WC455_11980 [Dehalococcoidia bacterium]|jgi:hypothetical protein
MAGNPYGGIAPNMFISNLFTSLINEKLKKKQEEQQAALLANEIAQQQFANRMAEDQARRQQQSLDYQRKTQQEQQDYARQQNAMKDYYGLVDMSGDPNITPEAYGSAASMFGQQYPQFLDKIPSYQVPRPKPMPDEDMMKLSLAAYDTGGASAGNLINAKYGLTTQQPVPNANILSALTGVGPLPTQKVPLVYPPSLSENAATTRTQIATDKQSRTDYAKILSTVAASSFGRLDPRQQQTMLRELDNKQQALGMAPWPKDSSGMYVPPERVPNYGALQSAALMIQAGADSGSDWVTQQGLALLDRVWQDAGMSPSPGVQVAPGGVAPAPVTNYQPTGPGTLPSFPNLQPPSGGYNIPPSPKAVLDRTGKVLDITSKEQDIAFGAEDQVAKREALRQAELQRKAKVKAEAAAKRDDAFKRVTDLYSKRTGAKLALDEATTGEKPNPVEAQQFRQLLNQYDAEIGRLEDSLITFRLPSAQGGPIRDAIIAEARKGTRPGVVGPKVRTLLKSYGVSPQDQELIWRKYARLYYYPNQRKK